MKLTTLQLVAALAVGGCGAQEWAFDSDGGTQQVAHTACASDSDCALEGLHCDVGSGECVACVNDSQCAQAGSRRCDLALNRCVQCGLGSDCDPGQTCEPITHRCVVLCTDAGRCPPDAPICSQGLCAACTSNADCNQVPGGRVCDQSIGRCVECTSDYQCPQVEPNCDRTTGECVQCLDANDCPPGSFCDPASSRCVSSADGSLYFPDGAIHQFETDAFVDVGPGR